MKAQEVKKGIYWVGAIDWHVRNFHGYTTDQGATYNAYLILDEKITLIDTVKEPFCGELIERIESIVPLEKIDYIVSNHVEPDHSGALPCMMSACPNATVVTSSPSGVLGLTKHYGSHNFVAVKSGDSLNIGSRTLQFVSTPMLHWPDNMVTYCPEEKILFSNDAFGQHFASTARFDDENPLSRVLHEAKKYYANIVMPYGRQAKAATEITSSLDIDIIAPGHGIIWRSNVKDILSLYSAWSNDTPNHFALIVFDSMWHSTELMAKTISESFKQNGIDSKLIDLKTMHISDILPYVLTSQYIAVGSPTLNNNMLPTVASFLCYLKGLSPKNRKAFAFGSYGWSGQSVGQVEEELKKCGFEICLDMLRIQYVPTKEMLLDIESKITAMLMQ